MRGRKPSWLWDDLPVAGSISEWQQRLDLEGSVTFRWSRSRALLLLFGGLVFLGLCVVAIAASGPLWWAVGGIALFGLLSVRAVYGIATAGLPSLIVTPSSLTRNGRREVGFAEIQEIITSARTFGFVWTPGPSDVLRGRWQRTHGLKYASIPAMGMADPELLATWILHLMGPSSELMVEPRYAGMGKSWRLKERREA